MICLTKNAEIGSQAPSDTTIISHVISDHPGPSSSPISTIAAISTGPAAGAVAIVRLSGPLALDILKRIFKPMGKNSWQPRQMRFGQVIDPNNCALLDEALAVWFPAPQSFTGEETVEIQGHGGLVVATEVLRAVLKAGATLAEPGEFTRRAFLNGRLDLTQAEAVADLISARSRAEAAVAARQLAGGLSEKISDIHEAIFSALVSLEAEIDFGDDVEPLDMAAFQLKLQTGALQPLTKLLADGQQGRAFREGLKLVLVGAPNVGKSSLFNALVAEDRALVSSTPGTTRDFITTEAIWEGVQVELCDTAGLSSQPVDDLDALGQARSRDRLERADVVLWVEDATRVEIGDDHNWASILPQDKTIKVWNKIDLTEADYSADTGAKLVSAVTGAGLTELKVAVLKLALGQERLEPPEIVPSIRHQEILSQTQALLTNCLNAAAEGQPPDICAFELRSALEALAAICGRTTPDDVLRAIFNRFCLGK